MREISLPRLITERSVIKLMEPQNASLMTRFRVENRQHLTQWEPTRSPQFYTELFWQVQLRTAIREFRLGNSVCLVMLNAQETEVQGVANCTNIVRGTFQACTLGYALAAKYQGQGIMFDALKVVSRYLFEEQGLNRIMANYLPRNARSGILLEKLGFEIEGQARRFLRINGQWEDHILTSLVNPDGKEDLRNG